MIARIRDAGGVVATLDDGPRWTAEDEAIAEALDTLLDTCERSPAVGDWIRAHVYAMAKVFGGVAEFDRPMPPAPPGRIY